MENRLKNIKYKLGNDPDIVTRVYNKNNKQIGVIFLKSTSDTKLIYNGVIKPILESTQELTIEVIKEKLITLPEADILTEQGIVPEILKNKTIVIINDEEKVISVDTELIPSRSLMEPPTSATIYGPREGFNESLNTTISLLRKRFPTENFIINTMQIGKQTKTKVSMFYLKDIANKCLVRKIEKKLQSINIDGIIDTYYVAEFLKEKPYSMFEQVGITEKPDIVASKILEGRIAIAIDGSPVVITLPFIVLEDVQNSNDYYTNYVYASLIRVVRLFGVLFSIIVPGFYLSIRLYHYRIVPITFINTIINSTQNLPFTPFLELIFILLMFQILYEVSLRLPRYLGLATSIVGALILGDTGVKAGLISPPGVIIIAMSIISIYTVPNQASQFTVLRLIFLFLGAMFGFVGIASGMIFFINHLASMTLYTAPYLAPFAPKIEPDHKDAIIKLPLIKMQTRPKSYFSKNDRRLK